MSCQSVVLLAQLPVVTQKPIIIIQNPVWNPANATQGVCLVVGSVNVLGCVVVSTAIFTISQRRTSGRIMSAKRNVSASLIPGWLCACSHCQHGEVCTLLNGVQGCHRDSPRMCTVKGVAHYSTFDGHSYDVIGNCTYLLTSYCTSWWGVGGWGGSKTRCGMATMVPFKLSQYFPSSCQLIK